jgi:chromosome segregation ATPase
LLDSQLKVSENEKDEIKKNAEEQTAIANSLYEDRLNEKDSEIEVLKKEVKNIENENTTLKNDIIKLDTKFGTNKNQIKIIKSLVSAYSDQLDKESEGENSTIKVVIEQLESLCPTDDNEPEDIPDKTDQLRELLKDKTILEK